MSMSVNMHATDGAYKPEAARAGTDGRTIWVDISSGLDGVIVFLDTSDQAARIAAAFEKAEGWLREDGR